MKLLELLFGFLVTEVELAEDAGVAAHLDRWAPDPWAWGLGFRV